MQHALRSRMARPTAIWITVLTLAALAFAVPAGTLRAAPVSDTRPTLWSCPNLPLEKTDVVLTFHIPAPTEASATGAVRFQVFDDKGKPILAQTVPLAGHNDTAGATLSWRPPHNGLYHVTASHGTDPPVRLDLPVLSAARALDFVWYQNRPYLRWATVITSASKPALFILPRASAGGCSTRAA